MNPDAYIAKIIRLYKGDEEHQLLKVAKSFHFSNGNRKLGKHLANFSVLPRVTCPAGVPCAKKCYACGICNIFSTVRNAWTENTALLATPAGADENTQAARQLKTAAHYFNIEIGRASCRERV